MPPLTGLKDSLGLRTTNMSLLTELPAAPFPLSTLCQRTHPAERDAASRSHAREALAHRTEILAEEEERRWFVTTYK
jgi:hypothetical protein